MARAGIGCAARSRSVLIAFCACTLIGACEGPTGPPGPAGPAGPIGPTGPEGPPGNSGPGQFDRILSWYSEVALSSNDLTIDLVGFDEIDDGLHWLQFNAWTFVSVSPGDTSIQMVQLPAILMNPSGQQVQGMALLLPDTGEVRLVNLQGFVVLVSVTAFLRP